MGKSKNKKSSNNNTKKAIAPSGEISVKQVQDKYSNYPSNGLTPYKLAQIFREADSGDVLRQMELFEEIEEKDPHLFSQLQTRKNAVTGLDYEVIPFSDDEFDKNVAEFVKEEFESLENIEDLLMDLLDAIGKGIAISEIIWNYDGYKTTVEDIKWIHQKKLFWDYNDDLKISTKDFPAGIELIENKFIIHKYKARSGHPSRAGVLRVVAWMYLFKNYDIKDWVSFCELFGMPLRLGKYNAAASESDKESLMQALIQIGVDAAGIIPDTTNIEFKESSKSTSINVYESLARYCDEQVSKAILGQTLTSDSGGGSYAQSKTHNDVRHDLTVADCKALANTLRRDLIRPLVLFNFGEDKRLPYIRFDCEEAEDLKQTADIYGKLICDIGLKIPTNHLYKKFSIPKPEDGEEIASPPSINQSQMTLKDNLKILSNKESNENVTALNKKYQNTIDDLADVTAYESGKVFEKVFQPILERLNKCNSLDELKEQLQSDKFVENLYKEMDIRELDELLQKSMFYADMLGRMKENEKSI